MIIRSAVPEDLPEIARAEELSFPEAEAASRETIAGRLAVYPDRFRVAVEDGRIAACVNGMTTDEPDLRDPSLTLPKKERTENKLKKSRFYADFLSFFY